MKAKTAKQTLPRRVEHVIDAMWAHTKKAFDAAGGSSQKDWRDLSKANKAGWVALAEWHLAHHLKTDLKYLRKSKPKLRRDVKPILLNGRMRDGGQR